MDNKLKTLILSAIFHDFGKFLQRNRIFFNREKHTFLGEIFANFFSADRPIKRFVENYSFGIKDFDNFESVRKIILLHHDGQNEDAFNLNLNDEEKEILEIIKKADRLAATTQRDILPERLSPQNIDVCQKDIFPFIFLDDKKNLKNYFHKISALYEIKNLMPLTEEYINEKQNQKDYERLIDNDNLGYFLRKIFLLKKIDFLTFLYHIDDIFEIFLTLIPEDRRDKYQLNSLYDHLRLTAAFSLIIYFNELNRKKGINEPDIFHYLNFDISGIQKFIFNIKIKKAAKILRGRSLFIQLLAETLAFNLLKKTNLIPQLVIGSWGGNVSIFLPPDKEVLDQVDNFFVEVNRVLLKNFGLLIRLNDFRKKIKLNPDSFADEFIADLYRLNQKNVKSNLFFSIGDLNEEIKPKKVDDSSLCDFCENPSEFELKEGLKSCSDCNNFLLLSEKITKGKIFGYDLFNNQVLDNLNNKSNEAVLFLKPFNNLTKQKEKKSQYFAEFPSKTIYYQVDNPRKSFEEMAINKKSAPVLLYLKGDIDNMSLILSQGLKFREDAGKKTFRLTDFIHFARRINLFFQNYLPFIISENNELKEEIYTIFSGGDDFFLVGHWEKMLQFLGIFDYEFKKFFCNNEKITLSLGGVLAKPNDPLFLISEKVEDKLKEAKKIKNRFAFLYSNLDLQSWGKIIDYSKKLSLSSASNSFFYKVFRITDYLKSPDKDSYRKTVAFQKIAYFYYRLIENFDDKKKEEDKVFIEIFNKILTIPRAELNKEESLFLENLKTVINLVLLYRRGGEENG